MSPPLKVENLSRQRVICSRLRVAQTFFSRLIGLMMRREIPPGFGLLIPHCSSIHTCFLLTPIDVLFLDRNWKVVKALSHLPPWRVAFARGASHVLELPPGTIAQTGTEEGDILALREE